MAASPKTLLFLSLLLISLYLFFPISESHVENPSLSLLGNMLDWPLSASSGYGDVFDIEAEEEDGGGVSTAAEDEDESEVVGERRSLFWQRRRYYISYGALSANRIPCPPRSGRSYYTHNCFSARGPVRPYNRGCSMITRCRR